MTNRKRFLSTSEYDTLVRMNVNTSNITGGRHCIMDVLHGKRDDYTINRCETYGNCEGCIAKWLNEEELYESERKDDGCAEAGDATGDTQTDR